jgi:hypothetical protein
VVKRQPTPKPGTKRFRIFPPVPKGFDAEKATPKELRRLGLPLRPDATLDPGLAAIWDRSVRQYRDFEHLQAALTPGSVVLEPVAPGFGLVPREACGFELTSFGAPFTILSGRWVVPNLHHGPTQAGTIFFRTFFGLGLLDAHVEMTVDPSQNVTSQITLLGSQVNLPVRPGDSLNVMLCLQTNPAGTAAFFLTNETTRQRMNLSLDTGFPPAVTINAGISRGTADHPFNPLADFGAVYFDELSAFTTSGTRRLVDGAATSMVDNGVTLARPVRLNDFAFRIDHA